MLEDFFLNKSGDSDGIVGELLKYGGSGMANFLEQLFSGRYFP